MRARDQSSILVLAGYSALTMGFYWSYTLLLLSPVLMRSCCVYTGSISNLYHIEAVN